MILVTVAGDDSRRQALQYSKWISDSMLCCHDLLHAAPAFTLVASPPVVAVCPTRSVSDQLTQHADLLY